MYEKLFGGELTHSPEVGDEVILNSNITDEEVATNTDRLQQLEADYVTSINRIDLLSKMWGDVNAAIDGTHAVVTSDKVTTKVELSLLQGAMDNALKDVDSLAGFEETEDHPALESFSLDKKEDIGLEVFKRAKDSVMKLIAWFVKQYQALVVNIKEFFKAHFSQLGRIQATIAKQREVLTVRDGNGYEMADADFEAGGWANVIQINTKVANLGSLVSGLNDYASISSAYQNSVFTGLDKCITEFDSSIKKIKVEDGKDIDLSGVVNNNLDKHQSLVQKEFGNLIKQAVNNADPRFKSVEAKMFSKDGLLGNWNLYRIQPSKNPESMAEKARAILQNDIVLRNIKWKLGDAKNDAKLPTLTLAECGEVLNAADGALNSIAGLSQNKAADSAIANLDKAFDNFDKMKSQLKSKEFTTELRQYLQMIGNQLTAFRKQVMDTPRSLSIAGTASINAATRWTGKSISNHKKA